MPELLAAEARKPFNARTLARASFPPGLSDLRDCPDELFIDGTLDLAALSTSVAIVGTRRPTEYGKRFAHDLAGFLAERGVCVVSGLALGIDAAAHQGALDAGGPTIAVLGTGLDIVYPAENKKIFDAIAQKGILLTEFPHGQPPERRTFPQRNRLVVALSSAVVVIESDATGGAMITAGIARKLGRRLFALPGRVDQPTSRGPHALIQQGATLITSPEDFWQAFHKTQQEEIPLASPLSPLSSPLPKSSARAKNKSSSGKSRSSVSKSPLPVSLAPLAQGDALSLDELSETSGLPIAALMPLLLQFEMDGTLVKRLDGKYEAS